MVRMAERTETPATNFNAIRISIASPEQMLNWSHGEVTKPETINYRTLRPEKDGLFCERLFGPTKDWECFCGKYKRIRYRGVVCDRCGVEVTRSKVRRERMGHIRLAAPVAHIWFSKTTPSRLGLLLDLSPRNLERVLYFAQHIVVSVDEEARDVLVEEARAKVESEVQQIRKTAEDKLAELNQKIEGLAEEGIDPAADAERFAIRIEIDALNDQLAKDEGEVEVGLQATVDELDDLRVHKLIAESRYRELKDSYGEVFQASMGAEAILAILRSIDLEALREQLAQEMRSTSGQRRKKAIKRLRVVESFRKSGNRVSDMILTILPVLPPELRPMVQLDGGRFATSDLNDLYRRVINRNNRLKRLMDLGAPEIIIRNEKRMLQESVDALIDNGRRGRPIQGSHNHKLKSLSDLLRGKQGRFRQNLLGKRVDYSGRSVIVVGPELKMDQCGLPKRMALELFKPFVMHRLVVLGIAPNIKSAKRMVERTRPEVWDILEDVIKDRPVMLNRAPTLHRLGIQAFMPTLIEGNAIQIHPLVCSAFNADFDGDQMAVHVPLSRMAVNEAKVAMLSTHNMLSPASGDPLVAPTLDMVMGCYYLTAIQEGELGEGRSFYDFDEAHIAYASELIDLRASIKVRHVVGASESGWVETTLGRLIFNEIIPESIGFKNMLMDRPAIKDLTAELYHQLTNEETAEVLDAIKELGFHYATRSGVTIAINDIQVSPKKAAILEEAAGLVDGYEEQYLSGLMSEHERYSLAVDAWTRASDKTEDLVKDELSNYGGIAVMAQSGTKGNISQIKQMAGMRGLMSNPKGRIIDMPIKSSFREGLTALEYFISTHGARKGLADTALRTADSGYLTRRLIDIAQDVIVLEKDCGTYDAHWVVARPDDTDNTTLAERVIGRMVATAIAHPQTGEILLDRNEEIDEVKSRTIVEAGITEVPVRSPLTCEARRGVCQLCYGRLPASGELVEEGQAAGIIAAQSIGEPGTQLTMRTFHTGGVAGVDITSGLPRVEELFEARVPKGAALLADIDGVVEIISEDEGRRIRVVSREEFREDYALPKGSLVLVDDGEYVEPGMILAQAAPPKKRRGKATEEVETLPAEELVASIGGHVELTAGGITIVWEDVEEREYVVPAAAYIMVDDGVQIRAGDALTAGSLNPHDILHIRGKDELQRYQVDQVQQVYRSQGVSIHDKHIEIILSRMLRRVQIESTGDADFIPGQMVDKFDFQDKNGRVLAEGGEPATAKPILLGVTRASLLTDSFLAAASFQETTRVLTQAAVSGAHDWLLGLKENVIIGRLIPARLESLSSIVEAEPEVPLEIEDMVPAGWLDMASEASSQFPFTPSRQEDVIGTGFFLGDSEERPGVSGDDDSEAGLLGGDGLLTVQENGGEVNGATDLLPIDEAGND
jgi:DNA-directed RNA polymerase subunit beta'